MKIIGLTAAFGIGHDEATTALMEDGKVLNIFHEERISRVKKAAGKPMPNYSLDLMLKRHGLKFRDVDLLTSSGLTHINHVERTTRFYTRKYQAIPPLELHDHHLCHAALTYYGSGFDRALIFTSDYAGEQCAGLVALGEGSKITEVRRITCLDSLGLLYGAMTQYLGFEFNEDEWKVMGLSAYAEDPVNLDFLVDLTDDGGYKLNQEYIEYPKRGNGPPVIVAEELYSPGLIDRLGPQRFRGEPLSPRQANVARGLQDLIYRVVTHVVGHYAKQLGCDKVCMAGGTALNVLANQKVRELPGINAVYVPPMSADDGIALGAAFLSCAQRGIPIEPFDNPYQGMSFTDDEIEQTMKNALIRYKKLDDPCAHAAEALARGEIIAWFQGASECGPRSLGNRSILGDARPAEMKNRINAAVKFREPFRPFAPSTTEEGARTYFENCDWGPFMTMTYNVKPQFRDKLQAITHQDGTARVHIVNEKHNPMYHRLITEFGKRTGIQCVVNTSFNVKGQPIVDSPNDALFTFYGSGLNKLYMGSFIVEK